MSNSERADSVPLVPTPTSRKHLRLPRVDFGSKKWAVFNAIAGLVTIALFVFGPFQDALGKTWSAVLVLVVFALILAFMASGIRSATRDFSNRLLGEVTHRQEAALKRLQDEYVAAIDAKSAEVLPLARLHDALPHLRDV